MADNDVPIPAARLNEIFVNPPGPASDDNREFIEIRSVSGGVEALTGLTLLVIEGDGSSGGIDGIVPLDSFSTGTNGLLLLGNSYTVLNPWAAFTDPATTIADLNHAGASGSNALSAGGLENGTITFLLVSGFSGVASQDLDTNDDGVFDVTPWTSIVDSVGWTDGGAGDDVYSAAVLIQSSGTSDAATRIATDTTAESSAAWYNGDILGTTETTRGYDATKASVNLPAGAGFTPGGSNYTQSLMVTPSSINVDEGSSNTFDVSLANAPIADAVVTITDSGDADLTALPLTLTFVAGSSAAQTVTVSAAEDADATNGSNTFTIAANALISQQVVATEVDNDPPPDMIPPTITDIIAVGSTWSGGLVDAVDGGGVGSGNGLGYSLTSGLILPNTGIDLIYIQFSEPVVGFDETTFALFGVNVADYSMVPGIYDVSYDSLNNRGVIQLSASISTDKLRIGVSDTVTDASLNPLDGDNNMSAGGVLDFRFNVLVGDASNDGSVNGGDLSFFAASFNQSAGNIGFNPRADWNSDGSVNGGDLSFFAGNFNQSLPAGEPAAYPPPAIVLESAYAPPIDDIDAFFSQLENEDELLLIEVGGLT